MPSPPTPAASNGRAGGENWIETAKGLFAQRRNLLSPSYLWMLRDILTFNQQSLADAAAGKLAGLTLVQYFHQRHFAPVANWRF